MLTPHLPLLTLTLTHGALSVTREVVRDVSHIHVQWTPYPRRSPDVAERPLPENTTRFWHVAAAASSFCRPPLTARRSELRAQG